MPLLRLGGERIYQSEGVFNLKTPNMFAGSILDLEEDTSYQVRLTLSDPDGGRRRQDRDGEDPRRAEALGGRACLSRLSAGAGKGPRNPIPSTT